MCVHHVIIRRRRASRPFRPPALDVPFAIGQQSRAARNSRAPPHGIDAGRTVHNDAPNIAPTDELNRARTTGRRSPDAVIPSEYLPNIVRPERSGRRVTYRCRLGARCRCAPSGDDPQRLRAGHTATARSPEHPVDTDAVPVPRDKALIEVPTATPGAPGSRGTVSGRPPLEVGPTSGRTRSAGGSWRPWA